MSLSIFLIGFAILQRLSELAYAKKNSLKLLQKGAVEYGREHYPFMVVLHIGWILAIIVLVNLDTAIDLYFFSGFVILQFFRIWVLVSLGEFWTTRIFVMPDHKIVLKGPFKCFKHPNYIVVALEIAIFPMIFGLVFVSIAFSLLNLILLGFRIRSENQALGFTTRGA